MTFNATFLDSGTQATRVRTLSYSVPIAGQSALVLSASRLRAAETTSSFFALLSIPFGERASATANMSRSGASEAAIATVPSSVPHAGGFGYRLAANRFNTGERLDAGLLARFSALEGTLDASAERAGTRLRADLRGALAYADGGWHPSRQILDGFALVRVPGLADSPVLVNGVPVGRTGPDGDFVVTPLFAYSGSRISIGTDELPLELSVEPTEQRLAAGPRAGAVARFRVLREEGMLLVVRLPDGSPLAAGASIRPEGGDEEALVGYDGKAFFRALRLPARLVAEYYEMDKAKPLPRRCAFELGALAPEERAQAALRARTVTCVPQ